MIKSHVFLVVFCDLVAANGAVQDCGKGNQDEGIFKRRPWSGPESGPSPEGEGGSRHVANGDFQNKIQDTTSASALIIRTSFYLIFTVNMQKINFKC